MNKKMKRTAVMIVAAFLIINTIIANITVAVSAQENENITVTEIDMGDYSDTMTVGDKQLLSVTVLPLDAASQTITYSSSNTAVATINGMGRITALSVGTTTITAACQGKSGSFVLTVKEKNTNDIRVKELDLGDYEKEMEVGTSQLLSVTPLPSDATNVNVEYKSSDSDVASINSMGRISALKIGKTTITVKCDEITSSIQISVVAKKDDNIEVKDIEIANHEDEVKVDETVSLTATVLPSDATETVVTYKSSNEKIATVNSSGEVKGISAGTVTITITAGKITKKEKIKVVVPTKSISMNSDYLVLKPGDSYKLSGTVSPSDAVQALTYKSINTNIATVSSTGMVTAHAVGNTSIVVSNGDYQAAVTVIVNTSENYSGKNDEDIKLVDEKNTVTYGDVVEATKISKIDSERLKYVHNNKTKLLIIGEEYTITIDGNDIVNYMNELSTDIQLQRCIKLENDDEKTIDGVSFIINDEKALCGDIVLCIDNVEGKYLYLYNEVKKQYERIESDNLLEIKISSPGKYVISNSKIYSENRNIIIFIIVGGVMLLVGVVSYIVLKKKYWFW